MVIELNVFGNKKAFSKSEKNHLWAGLNMKNKNIINGVIAVQQQP